MAKYEHILVATDFSEQARKALAEAVRIARRNDAQLHVLYVDVIAQQNMEGFDYPPLADYMKSMDQVALDAVGKEADVAYRDTVTAIVRDTSETAGILRYARDKKIDLIVIGTHGRNAFSEAFMGSVAQHVVRAAPVSVLVVGSHGAAPVSDPRAPILAPVDFTPPSSASLAQAGRLSAAQGASLIVMHVVDFDRVPGGEYRYPAAHEQNMRQEIVHYAAATHLPVTAETVVTVGPAAGEILRVAGQRKVGLIVLAPSRHNALERLLLGSVCKAVVRGASCPVLVHREPPVSAVRREAA